MGKSTVLQMFHREGALTISADSIVKKLLKKKSVLKKIREMLGEKVFDTDGRLIKAKVSDMIFKDTVLRHKVEDILHPLVFKEIDLLTKGRKGIAIVEAPVVFERGYEDRFYKTVVVYTNETTAIERLALSGIKTKEAIKRLSSQMPIKEKIKKADFAIDNSGTLDKTRIQVKDIYTELRLLKKGID